MLNILRSNFMVKFRPSVVDIFHSWHEWLTDWQTWSSSMTKKYIYDIILNDHSILIPVKLHYSDVTKLSYPLCLVNISKTRLFSVTSRWCDVDVTFSCVFSSVLSDSSRFSSPSCPRVFPATVIVCSALMCCTCVHYPLLLLLLFHPVFGYSAFSLPLWSVCLIFLDVLCADLLLASNLDFKKNPEPCLSRGFGFKSECVCFVIHQRKDSPVFSIVTMHFQITHRGLFILRSWNAGQR